MKTVERKLRGFESHSLRKRVVDSTTGAVSATGRLAGSLLGSTGTVDTIKRFIEKDKK